MIFIHIPKTAGTSFRLGASNYFGPKHELKDYGEDVKATSPLVKQYIYELNDYETFRKEVDTQNIKFVTGHFPSGKYLPYFDTGTFVTFVRDPVQRIVSEYKHAVRMNGFDDSLKSFSRRSHQMNRQWKFLKEVGIENMAFVGLTEQYERSIAAINAMFNTNIPILEKNVSKQQVDVFHPVDPEDADLIMALNSADMEIYAKAKERFSKHSQQHQLLAQKDRFLANVGGVRDGKIFGWVVNQTREVPVEISIFVNDKLAGHTLANRYRPDLKEAGIKRNGCGGVLFDIDQNTVTKGDTIEFRIKETQQVLGRTKLTG